MQNDSCWASGGFFSILSPHLGVDIYSQSIPSKHLFFWVYVRFDHKFTGESSTPKTEPFFSWEESQWVQMSGWELTKARPPLSRLLDWTLPFPIPPSQSAQSPSSCPGPFPSWPNLSPESPRKSSLSVPGMRRSTFVSESLKHFGPEQAIRRLL